MGRAVLAGVFAIFAVAASAAPTLTVAIDRSGEQFHDMALLEDVVDGALAAQHRWVELGLIAGGVTVTFGDTQSERAEIAALKKAFLDRKDVAVISIPARGFRFPPPAPVGEKSAEPPLARLENAVMALRPPIPGVTIEDLPDGAMVRATAGNVVELLQRVGFAKENFVGPVSPSEVHIAWAEGDMPAKRHHIGVALRQLLRDPIDLDLQPVGVEVGFVITEAEPHARFIAALRKGFAEGAPFVMRETPGMVMQFTLLDGKSRAVNAPDETVLDLMNEAGDIADPRLAAKRDGDTVIVRVQATELAVERLAAVRTALRARQELVVTDMPDGAVQVALVAGAHLFARLLLQNDAQMTALVSTRAAGLKIGPITVASVGRERVTVAFASDADREKFRDAITRGRSLQIRLVDESASNSDKHEAGSEKLPMQAGSGEGTFLWLKPEVILTGDLIASAQAETSRYTGQTELMISLNDEGTALFAAATKEHVGERLAIVIDGVVVTAPMVREPILTGAVRVDGNFTPERARDLVAKIVPEQGAVPLRIVAAAP
jgi:hypothetical protein